MERWARRPYAFTKLLSVPWWLCVHLLWNVFRNNSRDGCCGLSQEGDLIFEIVVDQA